MRAAVLTEIQKLQIVDRPQPDIKAATEVLVKVKAVGICGTDLHIFKSGRADVQLPRVMGHELAGIVMEVGEGVERVKVGDHVVLDPVFSCGICPTCQKGYPNVCDHVCCYGVQMDGGYQDYIVVDQKQLYPYDPAVSFETAALAEPFSIASNILERTQLTAKDNLLIIGSGTIGLSVLQAAKSIGAKVMVADIVEKKLAIAKEMGADWIVNSSREDLTAAVNQYVPCGFDVVLDAVGVTPLFMQSLQYAAPRARVGCIGFDTKPAEIPPVTVTKKELSIIGSRMNCFQFPTVIQWLNSGKICGEKMISRKYSLEDIQQAFEETLSDSEGSIKTLITFD